MQGTLRKDRRGVAALGIALLLLAPMGAAGIQAGLSAQVPLEPASVRVAGVMGAASACFSAAEPDRAFSVVAIEANIVYNHFGDRDPYGRMYVLEQDEAAVRAVTGPDARAVSPLVQPLVLRAHLGECVEVTLRHDIRDAPWPLPSLTNDFWKNLGFPLAGLEDIPDQLIEDVGQQVPEPEPFERASMHVHKLLTAVTGQGSHVGRNPDSTIAFGETITYRWYIPDDPSYEGAHLFHSHGDSRYQSAHGLFGALVAEPKGYEWRDATTGQPTGTGWEAIITFPADRPGKADAPDFREFVIFFHDEIEPCEADSPEDECDTLPVVDGNDASGAYGPGTKGMNYRSEPFMNRFRLHSQEISNGNLTRLGSHAINAFNSAHDESQAYSSYTYGDSAQPMARAYVGDPTKIRLVHGGPGQHHVFHLHGGGDRWRFQPAVAEGSQFADGFLKTNPVERSTSERTDVQNVGPGEAFNLEIEGGAGGVQYSPGDFLYHCHIVEHYVAGMWGVWRVYDTLQDGTDPNFPGQAPLAPLPDRFAPPRAVGSSGLVDRVLFPGTPAERKLVLGPTNLAASPPEVNLHEWLEGLLPAQGVPRTDDASVWDWRVIEEAGSPVYLGEPEVNRSWVNYEPQVQGLASLPGDETGRPELRFNPVTGRPAYPMLHPHLGKRPPFAAGHGPAPYLGEEYDEGPLGNPLGLCPEHPSRTSRQYNVVALSTEVRYNSRDVDPNGQVFVHAQDKAAVLAQPELAENLVLRANVHDCVDVTLSSQLDDGFENQHHSKVNMHIHLVQFDVQASDGVITGLNYEQSVRPVGTGAEVAVLASAAGAGSTVLQVEDAAPFLDAAGNPKVGSAVAVGLTEPNLEVRMLVAVDGDAGTVTLDAPLAQDHAQGEFAGYEFVRYRWYPDVELGMVYWHDHVAGMRSWTHGLFGGLVVEPAGSAWTDPRTGAHLRDGTAATASAPYLSPHVVDVHPPGEASFREFVASIQDRNFATPGGDGAAPDPYASINLRNAPWDLRAEKNGDPALFFSSATHGDPASTMPRAYPGDPMAVRLLFAGQSTSRGVTTFGITGHRFALEQHNPSSNLISHLSLGISDQFNFRLACGAGGGYQATPGDAATCTGQKAGDYVYYLSADDSLRGGAWGLLRVHDRLQGDFLPLPDRAAPPGPVDTGFPHDAMARARPDALWPLPASLPADPLDLVGDAPPPQDGPGDVGPPGAPARHFDVVALSLPMVYNKQGTVVKPGAAFYALLEDVPGLLSGALPPEPLVIRANAGEVVEVTLTNLLGWQPAGHPLNIVDLLGPDPLQGIPSQATSTAYVDRVSLAPTLMGLDPQRSGGITAGWNAMQSVAPGESITYRWYAEVPLGAVLLQDWSQVPRHEFITPFGTVPSATHLPEATSHGLVDTINSAPHLDRGLFGMLVVEPAGSAHLDPDTLLPLRRGSQAVIVPPDGPAFREVALLLETLDSQFESSTMPYDPNLRGYTGVNYRAEPFAARVGWTGLEECSFDNDDCLSFGFREFRNPMLGGVRSSDPHGDPGTALVEAYAGEPLVLRVAGATGAQLHAFTVEGHSWNLVPGDAASNRLDVVTIGPGEVANLHLTAGGGGGKAAADAVGDYLWGDHRAVVQEAGMWGLLRVHDPADAATGLALRPLPAR